jgi:hypothetical protein
MAKTNKIWKLIFWTLVIAVVLNGIYFYISYTSSNTPDNAALAVIATILTPVMSAINYVVAGFAAGLGFYLAKDLAEK